MNADDADSKLYGHWERRNLKLIVPHAAVFTPRSSCGSLLCHSEPEFFPTENIRSRGVCEKPPGWIKTRTNNGKHHDNSDEGSDRNDNDNDLQDNTDSTCDIDDDKDNFDFVFS